jgi:hypothetical protein
VDYTIPLEQSVNKIKAPWGSLQNHATCKISVCMNINLGKMHKPIKDMFKLAALLGKK